MGIKIDRAREDIEILNEAYNNRSLVSNEFYDQLEGYGVVINASILVSFIPDGANTYSGEIITQDEAVFSFDIDLYHPKYSIWDDISIQFYKDVKNSIRNKPWAVEVIAYQMFSSKFNKITH